MSDDFVSALSEFLVLRHAPQTQFAIMIFLSLEKAVKGGFWIPCVLFFLTTCSRAQVSKSTTTEPYAIPPIFTHGFCLEGGPTEKKCTFSIYVQPYKGIEIRNSGGVLKVKFSQADKTMALATVALSPVAINEKTATFSVSNSTMGGQRGISVSWSNTPQKNFPLVALDTPEQHHRFLRRIETGKQPKSAMFISDTKVVLPLLDDNHAEVVDILTGAIQRLELPPKYAKKGGFVESVRVYPLNEFWISQMMVSAIHRFDIQSLEYKGSIDLKGKWTKVLAYDEALKTVYASNWNSSDISVISIDGLQEERRIKMNGVPRGMAFSKEGDFMVAAIFGGKNDSDSAGRAVKIDLKTEKIVSTIISGGAQRHVVRLHGDSDRFAMSDMSHNKVYFIDGYKKVGEVKVYNNPNTIVESPDGKFLYVSCRGRNNPKSYLLKGFDFGRLLVIDMLTNTIAENIEAGNQPTGLDVSPNGRYVVLTDFLDHAMRVYERVR